METAAEIKDEKTKYWYALYVKPRHEFRVETELKSLEIENYLPTFIQVKQWSDRKKKVKEPLFKGYIFIYANTQERYKALATESVIKTVSFQGKPSTIPEWEINNLRKMLEGNPDVYVSDKIKIGTHVKIVEGPMAGIEGVVYRHDNDEMIAITIELLNRSVSVQLPAGSVTLKIDKK
ncbi:MAG: UpxY family transcription antiterminator [Melioribacteraceae bacterium]|jgi:transcription antitermination factor NusG|nr:UpxY family transcription antiterminator [Melioribacteraceae bacterium]